MGDTDRFSSYQYGEGRTGIDQLVEFSHPVDVKEELVKEFLKTNIRSISVPTTGRVNVGHGGYGQYTRYEVTQHKYAGGGHPGAGGYYEVLEIKNPPGDRWGIVIYENISPNGGAFTEWNTLQDALHAYDRYSNARNGKLADLSGFKRRVLCGALKPWFYAIGDEELVGDYTFPDGLQDDAIFRFGRQFAVFDSDGLPTVKTCMGTRFVKKFYEAYSSRDSEYQYYRLVYWDDGSVWNESAEHSLRPRPVEEDEMWIAEAVQQFKQLLAGKSTEFTINFTDGNKFVGKLAQAKHRVPCAEGRYTVAIAVKGKEPKGGYIDFEPTPEFPDVVQYVKSKYTEKGMEIERIEIKGCETKKSGKKWAGVFLHP